MLGANYSRDRSWFRRRLSRQAITALPPSLPLFPPNAPAASSAGARGRKAPELNQFLSSLQGRIGSLHGNDNIHDVFP